MPSLSKRAPCSEKPPSSAQATLANPSPRDFLSQSKSMALSMPRFAIMCFAANIMAASIHTLVRLPHRQAYPAEHCDSAYAERKPLYLSIERTSTETLECSRDHARRTPAVLTMPIRDSPLRFDMMTAHMTVALGYSEVSIHTPYTGSNAHRLLCRRDIQVSTRAPCGERPRYAIGRLLHLRFQPAPPCGERPLYIVVSERAQCYISHEWCKQRPETLDQRQNRTSSQCEPLQHRMRASCSHQENFILSEMSNAAT